MIHRQRARLARWAWLGLVCGLAMRVAGQPMAEPDFDQAGFDRVEVELAIKQLEADTFPEREKAEQTLQSLLKANGYPLADLLIKTDKKGERLVETRMRLRRILQRFAVPEGSETVTYQLVDWQGKPLAGCLCEVYAMTRDHYLFDLQYARFAGRLLSMDNGALTLPKRLNPPTSFPGQPVDPPPVKAPSAMGVVVYVPGCGAAGVVLNERLPTVTLPLAANGTKAAMRAARGVVVDEDGQPVSHAVLRVASVEIPGLGGYNLPGEAVAVTDHQGRFRYYGCPQRIENHLLPIGARYSVQVAGKAVFPHQTVLTNQSPQRVVIRRGKSFHRFEFVGLEVENATREFSVFHEGDAPPRTRMRLPDEFVREGGWLIPGTYSAKYQGADFASITVDAHSPVVLEFRMTALPRFTGHVYDAITGSPVADAIVFGSSGSRQKPLSEITDQQLRDLADQPVDAMKEHAVAKALNECKVLKGLTKTDADGAFSVAFDKPTDVYGFYTMAPGMLPYEVRALPTDAKAKGKQPVIVRDLFHFPAARITLTLVAPPEEPAPGRIGFWPEWKIEEDFQGERRDAFSKGTVSHHGIDGYYPSRYWVYAGERRRLTVPAGVPFRLWLAGRQHWAPIFVDQRLELQPGEQIDLGEFRLTRTESVLVKVVGPQGQPLEGVVVRAAYDVDRGWMLGQTTNERGEVWLSVARALKGQFGVLDLRGPNRRPVQAENLRVPFDRKQDANTDYTIRLTQPQLALLPSAPDG